MTSLDTVNDRPDGHDAHPSTPNAEAQCPYCGQPISREEFRSIQARIEGEERARIADVEEALKDRFATEKAKAETQAKAAIEKAAKDAAIAADVKIKALMSTQSAVIAARLEAQRIQLESKTTETIVAERTKMFAEKAALEHQLADMQRRLQAKTAHQLGEPAEVDLFDALTAAFPDDRISRVVKGQRGPDVIVEVMHGGAAVGSIALDSKNHKAWQNKFTSKLRADQLARGADFAVLSSSVFPSGAQQLHIQDNVIVANPARVPMLVHLLRRQIVENHRRKLTAKARNEKGDMLLAYIVSPGCTDLMEKIIKLTSEMVDLDSKEVSVHETTWKKRGELIRGVQTVHSEFSAAISRIVEGTP